MRILVVGSGGREHALAWKIVRSPQADALVCSPGNPGMALIAETRAVAAGFGSTADAPVLVCRVDAALAVGVTTVWTSRSAGGERAT